MIVFNTSKTKIRPFIRLNLETKKVNDMKLIFPLEKVIELININRRNAQAPTDEMSYEKAFYPENKIIYKEGSKIPDKSKMQQDIINRVRGLFLKTDKAVLTDGTREEKVGITAKIISKEKNETPPKEGTTDFIALQGFEPLERSITEGHINPYLYSLEINITDQKLELGILKVQGTELGHKIADIFIDGLKQKMKPGLSTPELIDALKNGPEIDLNSEMAVAFETVTLRKLNEENDTDLVLLSYAWSKPELAELYKMTLERK